MKYKNLVKKIAAYVCIGAMVITSTTGAGTITANAEEEVQVSDDIILNGDANGGSSIIGYNGNYKFVTLKNPTSDYKYLIITYKGSIEDLRMAFEKVGADNITKYYWFKETASDGLLKTVGDVSFEETQQGRVVVDLAATGIDLGNYDGMHLHNYEKEIKIGMARLSKTADIDDTIDVMPEETDEPIVVDPSILEPMDVTGLVKEWNSDPTQEGYQWLGACENIDAAAGYRYLQLTYKGDETAFNELRWQFSDSNGADTGWGWFKSNAQGTMMTVNGVLAPNPTAEEQTVIIDLKATGVDVNKGINKIDVHQNPANGNYEITAAKLYGVLPEELAPKIDEDMDLNEVLAKEWAADPSLEDGSYAWLGEPTIGAPAGYKYLQLTYKGDETAFDELRFEFPGGAVIWFKENAQGTFKTVGGEIVPSPTAEEQTVVIDLEKSGVDVTLPLTSIVIHQTAGKGSFTVTDAKLLAKRPTPAVIEDIILNGDEQGMSSMIKKFATIKAVPAGTIQYKYLGFATLKEPTSDYKYLILTYTGDISTLRFEFAYVEDGTEKSKTNPYWFNKEGQTLYFVTADESDIPLDGGKGTTIVIDLEKTGIDLDKYNSVYMHAGYGDAASKDINIQIGMARLSAKTDITAVDVIPPEQPTTPKAPTTTKAPETTTQAPVKAAKPAKAKIKKVTAKKKAAKKVKLSLKAIKNAKGYQVQFSTTKKFKKVLVKKFVKKVNVTVKSKKLKNKKKLFVRVRAYNLDGKNKVYGNFSKVKKVKIKK